MDINLDVQTATEMGISVYTVPGCCTEEVADSTMCHILNLYRRLTFLNESVRQGKTKIGLTNILVYYGKRMPNRGAGFDH